MTADERVRILWFVQLDAELGTYHMFLDDYDADQFDTIDRLRIGGNTPQQAAEIISTGL